MPQSRQCLGSCKTWLLKRPNVFRLAGGGACRDTLVLIGNPARFTENSRDLHQFIAAGVQNSLYCMSGRKAQLTKHFEKGVTMPALDTIDSDHADWSGPTSTTYTVSHAFESRFTAAAQFDKDDFLTWSSRQNDPENIPEYDE